MDYIQDEAIAQRLRAILALALRVPGSRDGSPAAFLLADVRQPSAGLSLRAEARYTPNRMSTLWPTLIGVFLGFVFGVGCALAVMYSIYMGGYRAAVRDAQLSPPPPRYRKALQRGKP